jgi:hypothetical protein
LESRGGKEERNNFHIRAGKWKRKEEENQMIADYPLRGDAMNQNPEQKARDNIDRQLTACSWNLQNKAQINNPQDGKAV